MGALHQQTPKDHIMANPLAFVTGASSGIGYNLAKVLAERGYDLFITSESDRLDKAEADFRSLGANVFALKADARQRDEVDRVWQALQATGRPIDVACINAGIGEGGLFATESSLDQELDIVQLNCASTVHFAKHIAAQMVMRKGGKILFTSSIAGEMAAPREAVYAASKAFVLHFSKALHFELKDEGITVTALQPGPTDTDFFERAHLGNTEAGTEGKKQSDPYDVAVDGIDALFAGKENVYAHATKLKIEGAMMGLFPDSVQAAMHDKMAKPKEAA
jgi:short-subunit dehydrogenase